MEDYYIYLFNYLWNSDKQGALKSSQRYLNKTNLDTDIKKILKHGLLMVFQIHN